MLNTQPSWWNEEKHGSAWDRVKQAMKRDWEQTKNDVGSKKAADLDQETVAARELREARCVMPADRRLQPRRRCDGDCVQLAPVEQPRELRLRALGGVACLEVDAAVDVADLVPDDHIGDESDGEDRDRRQGEHQPQPESEPQR